jgi:hypothetical protein
VKKQQDKKKKWQQRDKHPVPTDQFGFAKESAEWN